MRMRRVRRALLLFPGSSASPLLARHPALRVPLCLPPASHALLSPMRLMPNPTISAPNLQYRLALCTAPALMPPPFNSSLLFLLSSAVLCCAVLCCAVLWVPVL